ncbi:SUPT16H isoform 6 [Pongo abelii]|uniref:SUPT16H isoform 6 n=1 Tax=Pongo abelii TaxID=9601 RepID=A0A2J8TSI3_PONAB|nr:SUPT16H isoform 6 [Pongo abelii]
MAVTLDKDAYYRRVKRLYSNWREFPGSVPHPFRCSRIIHWRRPRTLPLNRESPAFTLSCGHHHLPRVPALVMHSSTSRSPFPP